MRPARWSNPRLQRSKHPSRVAYVRRTSRNLSGPKRRPRGSHLHRCRQTHSRNEEETRATTGTHTSTDCHHMRGLPHCGCRSEPKSIARPVLPKLRKLRTDFRESGSKRSSQRTRAATRTSIFRCRFNEHVPPQRSRSRSDHAQSSRRPSSRLPHGRQPTPRRLSSVPPRNRTAGLPRISATIDVAALATIITESTNEPTEAVRARLQEIVPSDPGDYGYLFWRYSASRGGAQPGSATAAPVWDLAVLANLIDLEQHLDPVARTSPRSNSRRSRARETRIGQQVRPADQR